MPTAIIGIGLPASGKTTFLRKLAGPVYVCPDEIRAELSGDAADQSNNDLVWARVYELIGAALAGGQDVAVDATNANAAQRQDLVRHCRKLADTIVGVWMRTPLATCIKRNATRARQVPEPVLHRMHAQLRHDPPSLAEGFDQLLEVA